MTDETTAIVSDPSIATDPTSGDSENDLENTLTIPTDDTNPPEPGVYGQPADLSEDLPGDTSVTEEDNDTVTQSFDRIIGFRDEDARKRFEEIQTLPGYDDIVASQRRRWANDQGNLLQKMAKVPKDAAALLQGFYQASEQGNDIAADVTDKILDPVRDAFSMAALEEMKETAAGADKESDFYREFSPYLEGQGTFVETLKAWGRFREEQGLTKGRSEGATQQEQIIKRKLELLEKSKRLGKAAERTPPEPNRNSTPARQKPDLGTIAGVLASNISDEEKRRRIDAIRSNLNLGR